MEILSIILLSLLVAFVATVIVSAIVVSIVVLRRFRAQQRRIAAQQTYSRLQHRR